MPTYDTHYTVPSAASALFYSQLVDFLNGSEDAARYADMFDPFVVEGLIHAVPSPGSLTSGSTSGTGYTNMGHYVVQEATTITYGSGDGTYWVIATGTHDQTSAGFQRVIGTHFMYYYSLSQPELPQDALWLMEVTVAGDEITAVTDLRNLSLIEDQVHDILIDLIENDADVLAALTEIISNIIETDPDIADLVLTLISSILSGLDFVDGANVGAGTGELFRDITGTLPETLNMKTIVAGDGIVLTNGADDITLDVSVTNVGSGENIYKDATGTTLNFRGINGVGDITAAVNGDNIDIEFAGYTGGMVVEEYDGSNTDTTGTDPIAVMTLATTPDTTKDTVVICTMVIQNTSASSDSGDNSDTVRLYKGVAEVRTIGYEAEDLWSKTVNIHYVDTSPGTNQEYSLELVDLKGIGLSVQQVSMIAIQF